MKYLKSPMLIALVLTGTIAFSPSTSQCLFGIDILDLTPECMECIREHCSEVCAIFGELEVQCIDWIACFLCGLFNCAGECLVCVPVELSTFEVTIGEGAILLTWTTGSETENLGYHIYRCLTIDGEYEKLTLELIEGAGSSRTTQAYKFIDQDVQDGATYFYILEQVNFDGMKTMYGPVTVSVGKETAVQPSTWGAVKALLK